MSTPPAHAAAAPAFEPPMSEPPTFEPPALAAPALAPVVAGDRFGSVDTLRGVAVLGILAMNIMAFAMPMAGYFNPMSAGLAPYQGEFSGVNRAAWWVQYLVFDMKMITIFSMLFGAGLVLMHDRASVRARRGFAGVYYRRLAVLAVVGLVHAYLIWFGDVLFIYALCGLLLYPLRRFRPATLMSVGVVLVLVGMVITSLLGLLAGFMRDEAGVAQAIIASGGTPTREQQGWLDGWNGMNSGFNPTPEQAKEQIESFRGPASTVVLANAAHALPMHLFMFPLFFFWRTAGMMLIGMGLMKLGVFSARRSPRFYGTLMLVGYGVGLALLLVGARELIRTRFDAVDYHLYTGHFNAVGSVFVALGHVGLVMLVCQKGALAWLTGRLGAVGRMAFTNYLSQSLICTTIFYGWGLGYFGALERAELMLVVLGVWLAQLLWSPWWLARFRFGPAEWLWRTLTYAKVQPMRI